MEGLSKKLLFITALFLIVKSCSAQKMDSKLGGDWAAVDSYYNRTMKLSFSKNNYTETILDVQTKKVLNIYKARFRILNDSVVVLKTSSTKDIYRKVIFLSSHTIKFFPYKKDFKESIPFVLLFSFTREEM